MNGMNAFILNLPSKKTKTMSKNVMTIKMSSNKEKSPTRNIIAKEMIDRFHSGGPMRDRRERRPKDRRTWLADYQQDEALPDASGAVLDGYQAPETALSEEPTDKDKNFWEWFGNDPCPNNGMLAGDLLASKLKDLIEKDKNNK